MNSSNRTYVGIDAYIRDSAIPMQPLLKQMREAIHAAAPKAVEAIKYGMPTFMLAGKNLVHFAAMKTHMGFYPAPSGIRAFAKELTKYKTSKGAIQFPLDKPLPLALVKKITKYRVTEVKESINNKK